MRRRQILLGAAAALAACDTRRPAHEGAKLPPGVDAILGAAFDGPPEIPDEPMLVGRGGLPRVLEAVSKKTPAWQRLEAVVRDKGAETSAENLCVVYLGKNRDRAVAVQAVEAARKAMSRDPRADSYLFIGEILRPVAMVLDHCGPSLEPAVIDELQSYLATFAHELWFDNKGSGWGLDDPGNNYNMAFLEGTAFAAYALARRRHEAAPRLLAILKQKIEGPKGLLAYLDARGAGGDWQEGANYGQRAKQRLFMALSAIATMGGPSYFSQRRFFRDCIHYAVYQLQPDLQSIYPSGDLSRESAMRVSPYDRDYIQLATYWAEDEPTKALGRWYLEKVTPSYEKGDFTLREALYKDVLFPTPGPVQAIDKMAKTYLAPGNGWVTSRSGWTADATCLSISASPILDQSHAHVDVGSFTLFKGGWQAADAGTYSRSGLLWTPASHNMLHVEGEIRREALTKGLTRFHQEDSFSYVQVDGTDLFYRRKEGDERLALLQEWTREIVYLAPDTVVILDRVTPHEGVKYDIRFHFPAQPEESSAGRLVAKNERGSIALAVLKGGRATVRKDDDLEEGGSRAWRVQVEPDDTRARLVTVLKVGLGDAPVIDAHLLDSAESVIAATVDKYVVVFSNRPRGEAADAPFDYRVRGGDKRTHIWLNGAGKYDFDESRAGGDLELRVRKGSRLAADKNGLVRFDA